MAVSGVPMIERTRKSIDFLHISSTRAEVIFSINQNTERAGKSQSYFYFRFRLSDDVIRNEIFVSPKVFNYSISHHNFIKMNDILMFKDNSVAISQLFDFRSQAAYSRV